ncbi:DUF6659 family protein [Nitrososphaera sp.]|uniref:DUF6659 family protein n=1 Tax=Nitrososphaera sp. TaxID=1971748 RepID=UPI00307D39DF
MDFAKLCDRVFALNDDIRYVAVIDDIGTVVAGGMRKGTDSITNQANDELYLAQTALRKSMRERFDQTMGKARFAYVERDKISILTFFMDSNTLVLTLEPNLDSHTAMDIAEDTLDLLGKNNNSS